MTTRRVLIFAVFTTIMFVICAAAWRISYQTPGSGSSATLPCLLIKLIPPPARDVYDSPTGRYVAVVLSRRAWQGGPTNIDEFEVYDRRACTRHRAKSVNTWNTSDITWSEDEHLLEIAGTHFTAGCERGCTELELWRPDGSELFCVFMTRYTLPEDCRLKIQAAGP